MPDNSAAYKTITDALRPLALGLGYFVGVKPPMPPTPLLQNEVREFTYEGLRHVDTILEHLKGGDPGVCCVRRPDHTPIDRGWGEELA